MENEFEDNFSPIENKLIELDKQATTIELSPPLKRVTTETRVHQVECHDSLPQDSNSANDPSSTAWQTICRAALSVKKKLEEYKVFCTGCL
jgi:hypothetical protein